MYFRSSRHNKELVYAYATRVVSLSRGVQVGFEADGVKFVFTIEPWQHGKNKLRVHTDAERPEELVMLIKGLGPCKDTAFKPDGTFFRYLPANMYQLSTRLAIRDPNKRRRKFLQELRLAEAAQIE